MKEKTGKNKSLRFIFAAAFIMILAMGTIALTGCGGGGGTQQVTGIALRGADGALQKDNLELAVRKLKAMGVSTWAAIHCPEGGFGVDENDVYHAIPSLHLPKDWIKGTVGAGDAFCAGVLYCAEMGKPMDEALKLGASCAAASLNAVSASDGVRSVEECLKLCELYA